MNEELVNGDGAVGAPISSSAGISHEAAKWLMVRLQKRDNEALTTLLNQYNKLIVSVAAAKVGSAHAEDVAMITWMEVLNHAHSYDPSKGTPISWIISICSRRSIDWIRRTVARERAHQGLENEQSTSEDAHDGCDVLDRNEVGSVLSEQLKKLPAEQQEVLILLSRGFSQREIAEITHTPLGTVKTRMELGLKKLRQNSRISCLHVKKSAKSSKRKADSTPSRQETLPPEPALEVLSLNEKVIDDTSSLPVTESPAPKAAQHTESNLPLRANFMPKRRRRVSNVWWKELATRLRST
ncbi:MAG: sigma-70 family RNA polymerase sigma factor [Patescibacteria group bacterium]